MIRFASIALSLTLALTQAQTVKHRFLAVDNGLNKLLLVDEITKKGWTISIPAGSRDLQLLPGNKVLVSHGDGAAEYDLTTGSKGWFVNGYSGVSSARRLLNGNTLLGTSDANAVTLFEVGNDKIQKAKYVATGLTDMRLMRPLENGNFLLTLASTHKLTEVNTSGTVVWSATLTDKPYLAHRLSNGHTLSTSGEDCRVYDISPDGKSMTLVAGSLEKHPSAKLLWFSGFEILANGHYFVANWNGHGMEGKGPHALEFDSNNNIVWQWDDPVAASTVTNILTFEIGTTGLELHRQYYFRRPAVYEGVRFDAGKSVLGTLGPARIEIGSQGFLANGSLATGLIPEGRRSDFRESRE